MGVCSSNETQVRVISANELPSIGPSGRFHKTMGLSKGSKSPPKLAKRESDMNLIPQELHKLWFQSDESKFEREKHLLVLCPNTSPEKAARVCIVDVDYQSRSYGKVLTYLNLPKTGDDPSYMALPKNPARMAGENASNNASTMRNLLVVPCMNTSRIYVIAVDESSLQLRVQRYISDDELLRWDASCPLTICSGPGRGNSLLICTLADGKGCRKGDILRLDRRLFTIERKINEAYGEEEMSGTDSPTYMPNQQKIANFGGSVALLYKQGILFSTEWGEPKRLEQGFQHNFAEDDLYGCAINVWDVLKRRLLQTIRLDKMDGRMTVCIRLMHHVELMHGYICSAIGGAIFHLHKNSKTGFFSADRVLKFPPAIVEGWMGPEVTAFPSDMVISMDDDNLFVACWLQGFIAQFDITDPFKPTAGKKIFLGGVILQSLGVELSIACAEFVPQRRTIAGKAFEGGPSRLQLSLDGRRLWVTNSFYRPWDEQIYPGLIRHGSSIALIHIDSKSGEMKLDEQFGVHFDEDRTSNEEDQFLAREMKFLNGDCTSDLL